MGGGGLEGGTAGRPAGTHGLGREMLATLRQVAGDTVADLVTITPDPAVEAIVGSSARRLRQRARRRARPGARRRASHRWYGTTSPTTPAQSWPTHRSQQNRHARVLKSPHGAPGASRSHRRKIHAGQAPSACPGRWADPADVCDPHIS